MSTDTSLIVFKSISNFTRDLDDMFGDKHRPLKLYAHLISKTTISHEEPIRKHIETFRQFCVENREAIFEKDVTKLQKYKIVYSKRVYIDMLEIFGYADAETKRTIWKHFLAISALVDPNGKAREILKEQFANSAHSSGGEEDFLSNIMAKVEEIVDPNADPMEAISSIMKSGLFTELVEGMKNEEFDLGKLMSSAEKMVSKLSGETEGGEQAVNIMSTLMGAFKNQPKSNEPPDISAMIGPILSALMTNNGGLTPQTLTLEERVNSQTRAQYPRIREDSD